MRVLVTGSNGFFGAVLTDILSEAGHEVTGLDAGYFDPRRPGGVQDVRDVTSDDLRGQDAVVHLAALSNDASGELSEAATRSINEFASVRLAELARDAGVGRFVFASSCSVYGTATEQEVDESGPVAPLTAYARSKLSAEAAVVALAGGGFCPVALRFATLFGHSPAFRSDLLVNRMVSTAVRFEKVWIYGDGSTQRPLLDVSDASRAIGEVLEADAALSGGEVFNVGGPNRNYQIGEVAELVRERFPNVRFEHVGTADQRSYRVRFDRFAERFDGWRPKRDARDGVHEVADALARGSVEPFPRTGSEWGRTDRSQWLSLLRSESVLSSAFRWSRLHSSAR